MVENCLVHRTDNKEKTVNYHGDMWTIPLTHNDLINYVRSQDNTHNNLRSQVINTDIGQDAQGKTSISSLRVQEKRIVSHVVMTTMS
ncbi:hypothetical protein RRG08_016720 [Elysia crispata]|uniref:Uncharacterized protein n=1 Tax=Elysia crispata TaxID=231223 RepID=A0AAE1B3J4_9GAST|nr:hypothetical protein RRG08_016720 [Elysia crispata]